MSPQTEIFLRQIERGHERLVRAHMRAAMASALLDSVQGRLSSPPVARCAPPLKSPVGDARPAGPN